MRIYPDTTHLQACQLLEHYQLVQRLDKRQGIEIWHAQHIHIQVPVVLKILLSENRDREMYLRDERFLQNEARVLSSLHHQHIIGYRDYLEGRNFSALVLEYAPYGSIAQYHGRGRKLPLSLVRLYIAQMGCALEFLHRQERIHRDVKPSNILLLDKHHALLADFELAISNPIRGYTRKHYTGGTPFYMAPEQSRGLPDATSDQYSLAVCAYEWLTGHRPFAGDTEEMQVRRALRIPRSVRIERPELPVGIDQVMWTALHPDARHRYPTVVDFTRAFVEVTRRARPPLYKRWPYYRTVTRQDEDGQDEWNVRLRRAEERDTHSGVEEEAPVTQPRERETGEQYILPAEALSSPMQSA